MLEKLLQSFQTFEKYTVRLADEGVHRLVSKPVEWIERKGVPRRLQAVSLDGLACFTAWSIFTGELLYWACNVDLEDRFMDYYANYLKQVGKFISNVFPLLAYTSVDSKLLILKEDSHQRDGTIARDEIVNSYNSIGGVVRPYALGASIGAIVYGFFNHEMDLFKYGTIGLPAALSLYVRDGDSGGLLDSVRDRLKQFVTIRSPLTDPNQS